MESIYFHSHPITPDNPFDMIYDRSKPIIGNTVSIQSTNIFPKKMKTLDEILGGDSVLNDNGSYSYIELEFKVLRSGLKLIIIYLELLMM